MCQVARCQTTPETAVSGTGLSAPSVPGDGWWGVGYEDCVRVDVNVDKKLEREMWKWTKR